MRRKELMRNEGQAVHKRQVADLGQVVNLGEERTKRRIKEEEEQSRKDEEKIAFKECVREAVNAEHVLRKQDKSSLGALREVTKEYFEEHQREGVMMFPRNNRRAYTNLYLTKENTKQKSHSEYLIVVTNKIMYVNIETDVIKTIDLSVRDTNDIHISSNPDMEIHNNSADVFIEDGDSIRYIIKGNEFVDDKVAKRYWKNATLTGEEYKTVNFTIDKQNINMKVHHLYMLLRYGLPVVTMLIWSGAGPYCPDHDNGIKCDNRIDNLKIIPQPQNAGKRGSMEEHLSFDTYDYALALKLIADEVERHARKIVS